MSPYYNRKEQKETRQSLRNAPTFAEKHLWTHLRRNQILNCKFRRQYGVGPYVLDFYSPEARLAIEVDGATHDDPVVKERDKKRQAFVESHEIEFLRLTDNEVLHYTDQCLSQIRAAVSRRRSEFERPDWYGRNARLSEGSESFGDETEPEIE